MNKNLFFLLLIISASYIHGMKRLSFESDDSDRPFKKQENMHNVFQIPEDLLRDIFSHEAFKKSECEIIGCENTGQNISGWTFHNSISEDNAISDIKVDYRGYFAAVASGDTISYINVNSEDPYDGSYMLTNHDRVRAISMRDNDLAVAAGSYVEIFDTKTAKSKVVFHDTIAEKICLSPDGKLVAVVSDFKIDTRDSKTKKLICENSVGLSGDGTVRIFKKYTGYTREQLILKFALLNWFLIEKPNKKIVSLATLLEDVSHKSGVFLPYIVCGWRSFPENMQGTLLSTMLYRIQKYGKDPEL